MSLRQIPMVTVLVAVTSAIAILYGIGQAQAGHLKIVIMEAADETIGTLEETDGRGKTLQVCGFAKTPACIVGKFSLPVPIGAKNNIITADIKGTKEKVSDSIGFGFLPGGIVNGVTGFSSPGGNDNSAADTETGETKSALGATVDIVIKSPAEGNGTGVPELSTWAMMLIGFGLCGLRLCRRKTAIAVA